MKTTGGKTKAARKPARAIQIHGEGHRGIIAVKRASSLKQALSEYWAETLKPRGYTDPHHVGNTLTVKDQHGNERMYKALEAD